MKACNIEATCSKNENAIFFQCGHELQHQGALLCQVDMPDAVPGRYKAIGTWRRPFTHILMMQHHCRVSLAG
ncbi:hypothetical protein D3C81_2178030 [compost metagenome]